MLVGDEDAVDALGTRPAQRLEPPQHFFASNSGVNEEGRALRSSNVQLPVLPDARMEIRSEMRFPQCCDSHDCEG